MRGATEYLLKALAFDALAAASPEEAFKKRYADLAACYRLLAAERERLIREGTISTDAIWCTGLLARSGC
jgi:hypothetical protein